MKLTKTLQHLRIQFYTQLIRHDIYLKGFVPLCLLSIISAGIWYYGADLVIHDVAPLATQEKRIYIILALFAAWALKFVLFDTNVPNPFNYQDAETRKRLADMQKRFHGALQFLKKTTVTRDEETQALSTLPTYLLIGPVQAGKTSLLANANVHYVLQRQFHKQDPHNLPATENCDWWVTRDLSIIDVPGKYICAKGFAKNFKMYPLLWRYFLRLMKKTSGKQSIKGIIIALPLPEILKQNDAAKYQIFLNDLFPRIKELQKIFPQNLPIQILITKCDLLPGFSEFFAESNNDEINQAWGIALNDLKPNGKVYDLYSQRFNELIKKLNQQLIWRLHQERNPLARPFIKDFPLQIERLKETLTEFIKQYSTALSGMPLQGVYLTSALQIKPEPEVHVIDHATESSERALQLFKAPQPLTRPYFIKQFIALGLQNQRSTTIVIKNKWKRRSAFAASFAVICGAGYIFGHDFQLGIQQAYSIQNNISEFQVTLLKAQDPEEQLLKTVELMDSLQQIAKNNEFKLDLSHLLSFYSYKSQQKAGMVYQQALQTILLPEIKVYIAQFLRNPVNKNNDMVYSALKAYLMLGDPGRMQTDFIVNIIRNITPKNTSRAELNSLSHHLAVVFSGPWTALNLDKNTVDDTRKYLNAIPNFDLSYIILKTYNNNNSDTKIDLGINTKTLPVFINQRATDHLPLMFTAKNFDVIYNQQIMMAATDATVGNWVLGDSAGPSIKPESAPNLVEQLRNSYVNNYIDTWEGFMTNTHLVKSKDLQATDEVVVALISDDSPLLQFLQTIHDNTYFEPLAATSSKLQEVGLLIEKNVTSQQKLYQLFTVLREVHNYIQTIQNDPNEPKAAFESVSSRMKNQAEPDILTQLRIVASTNPEPIKSWLLTIADETWRYLMIDSSHYINTSWQNEVVTPYQSTIANRFPFVKTAEQEVDLNKFVSFFGNPGTFMNFYHQYLEAFVEASGNDWHWKTLDNMTIPFNAATLRQIQQATRIHHTFFPNGDDKMYVQFALQPHKFSKLIKSVKLNINDKHFVDVSAKSPTPHVATWPSTSAQKMAAVQLRIKKQDPVNMTYLGDWAWFKLVNQSVQNMVSKKELLLNFYNGDNPVQYLLYTESNFNPFLSLNLNRLKLPEQLIMTSEGTKDA